MPTMLLAGATAHPRSSVFDRRDVRTRNQLLERMRAEFEEMPGLRLTLRQAGRLFNLREDVCFRALTALVREGVLRQTPDRQFARTTPR